MHADNLAMGGVKTSADTVITMFGSCIQEASLVLYQVTWPTIVIFDGFNWYCLWTSVLDVIYWPCHGMHSIRLFVYFFYLEMFFSNPCSTKMGICWCHPVHLSLHLSIFTQGQFWPSGIVIACVCVCVRVCVCQSVCQSLACPRDNSGPVQARIAKFGPKMQKTLVKVPIVLGGNWPWPSRSNLTSKSEFTNFWACPDHNSSPIQVRITKFGPEVENSLVKVPIILGGNWPWTSRSNLI